MPGDFKGQLLEMAINPEVLAMTLLSAHMIIFWLSQDSNVTPPVCLTAFAAAAIAKTPPMATGFMAWKVAKGLYIVPVLFAYTNFIGGTTAEVLSVFFFSLFGTREHIGGFQALDHDDAIIIGHYHIPGIYVLAGAHDWNIHASQSVLDCAFCRNTS